MKDSARVTEVAPDHYAISAYVPEFNLRFNHFLIKDEEPLLFHSGRGAGVNDFSLRRARVLAQDETLKTGKYRFRCRQTPHVPHN